LCRGWKNATDEVKVYWSHEKRPRVLFALLTAFRRLPRPGLAALHPAFKTIFLLAGVCAAFSRFKLREAQLFFAKTAK